MSFHGDCRLAIRNRLAQLVKATTSPASATLSSGGLLTRTDAGDFTGFHAGDEISVSGFTGDNNGLYYVTALPTMAQLQLRLPEGDSRVLSNQTAVGATTVVAGLPQGQDDDNTKFVPTLGQPWFRESYKRGTEQRRGLGKDQVLIRLNGLYLLSLFYPKNVGALGLDGMSEAVTAVCSAGTLLTYNGQKVTIMSCSGVPGHKEDEWESVLMSIKFQADRFYTPLP